MKRCPNTYYVTVIEDVQLGQVVGAATLVVEKKFIRNCAVVNIFYNVISYNFKFIQTSKTKTFNFL